MKLLSRFTLLLAIAGLGLAALGSPPARAADDKTDDAKAIADNAVAYLRTKQAKNGSFSEKGFGPGVTALVVAAMIRNGYTVDDPTVKKAIDYLTKKVQKNGGIYDKKLANYTTSVAMMALKEANKDGKFDTILKDGAAFLKSIQQNDPAGKDIKLGGVGYDAESRPDLSNTQMFLDALLAAGVPKNDPAVLNAIKFISRCQNLPSKEGNDQPFAAKAKPDDKGGFVYVPDPDDEKHANGDGGLRSLGSMTYAGLKSFLYAGVDKKDLRVQGAVRWIRAHYTLEENPGYGQAGLYYYYHTFAKAMEAFGEENFADSKGVKHEWRKDLLAALKKRQNAKTGSFAAESKKEDAFGEGDPSLATAFALLSLSYTKK